MDEIQRAQDDLFYATFPQALPAPARQARVEAAHAFLYAPECIDALPSQLTLSAPLNYSGVYDYPDPASWAFYGGQMQQQQPARLVMPQPAAASPEPVSAVSSSSASSYYNNNDYPEELTPPPSASYADTAFGADAYAYPYPHPHPHSQLDGQFSHVLIPPAPDPLAHYPSALDMSLPPARHPLPPYPLPPTRHAHGEKRTRTEPEERRNGYYRASPLPSDSFKRASASTDPADSPDAADGEPAPKRARSGSADSGVPPSPLTPGSLSSPSSPSTALHLSSPGKKKKDSKKPAAAGSGTGKDAAKKPPLACLFCRGRKIACGAPSASSSSGASGSGSAGGSGTTNGPGPCNQCQRRALVCEYPAESRRGMRKKKAMPEGPPSACGSSSLPSSDMPAPVPAATTAAAAGDAPSVPGPDATDADTSASASTSVDSSSTGAAGRTRDPRPRAPVVVKTESEGEGEGVPSDTGAKAGLHWAR